MSVPPVEPFRARFAALLMEAGMAREAIERAQGAPPLEVALVEQESASAGAVAAVLRRHCAELTPRDPVYAARAETWSYAQAVEASGVVGRAMLAHALREWTTCADGGRAEASLLDFLLEQADLPEGACATLGRLFIAPFPGGATTERGVPEAPAASPMPVAPPTLTPVPLCERAGATPEELLVGGRLGKYRLVGELGRGGMGVVLLAFDTELKRSVALKTVAPELARRPDHVERLLREARTAGALDHPGIVAVHEAGEIAGVPFFAMAYVRGRTLDAHDLPEGPEGVRARVALVLQAAEAVAHAHQRRIVHRDLKPSNLIVDAAGRVRVTDFGLALRLDQESRLTAPGVLIGTPRYMAPEQVTGDPGAVGPPADVWALGMILHELLAGEAPFPGRSAAIEGDEAVPVQAPPSLRDRCPAVSRDLESVVAKALRPEPEDRYPTARELAGDLARVLAGELPRAIRDGPARFLRRLRRHRVVVLLGAALLIATLVAGLVSVEHRRLIARLRDDLRSHARKQLDAALELRRMGCPKAGLERQLDLLRPVAEALAREEPDNPEPDYHMGRMLRAVMRWSEALAAQERALARRPGFGPALYERAMLLAREYEQRLEQRRTEAMHVEGVRLSVLGRLEPAVAPNGPVAPPRDRRTLERDDLRLRVLRARIVADLQDLEWAGGVPPAQAACARGVWALDDGDVERAERLLEGALLEAPALEEAHAALLRAAHDRGDYATALDRATRALTADPGYVPHALNRSAVRVTRARDRLLRNEDPTEDLTAAVADADRALVLDPDSAGALRGRALARIYLANWREYRGADAAADYRSAQADLDRALELDPRSWAAWVSRSELALGEGERAMRRGEDPGPAFERALADLDRALEADPGVSMIHARRGMVRGLWARDRFERGGDPEALYAAAIADLDAALEREPDGLRILAGRAGVRVNRAIAIRKRGGDARPEIDRALADLDRALALAPADGDILLHRATARFNRSTAQDSANEDPASDWALAEADLLRAAEALPQHPVPPMMLAHIAAERGKIAIARGQDAGAHFDQALQGFGRALALDPNHVETLKRRAWVYMVQADQRSRAGSPDAAAGFEAASADLDRAIALEPGTGELRGRRGNVRFLGAGHEQRQGRDPTGAWTRALADYDEALRLNPGDRLVLGQRAMALEACGRYAEAVAAFDALARADPSAARRLGKSAERARRRVADGSARWLPLLAAADGALLRGDAASARRDYEGGLAGYRESLDRDESARRALLEDAEVRERLMAAHYNLACLLAKPGAEGESEAGRKDAAFRRLREAIELGWSDAGRLEADADFAALHGDPRWTELVAGLRR